MDTVQTISDDFASSAPPEFRHLSTLLEESPETLATGNREIQSAALNATKYIFDLSVQSEISSRPHIGELLLSLAPSQAPQTRSKVKAASEKSTIPDAQRSLFEFTPLKSLFVDGMDEEQIWAQLDLRTKTICRMLDFVLEGESDRQDEDIESSNEDDDDDKEEEEEEEQEERLRQALEALEGGEDVDMEELMAQYGLNSEGSDDPESSQHEEESNEEYSEEEEEGISPLRDSEVDEEAKPASSSSKVSHSHVMPSRKKKRGSKVSSELDDGFFDLAEFNAETERAESKSSSKGRLAGDEDSDEDDMDIDLFAAVDMPDDFDDADPEEEDGAELFYRDFFEPPSRPSHPISPVKSNRPSEKTQVRFNDQVRVKKIKATGKNRSLHDDSEEDDDEDGEEDEDKINEAEDSEDFEGQSSDEEEEQWDIAGSDSDEDSKGLEGEDLEDETNDRTAIQRLKHDLFAEDEEEVEHNTTTHERRMADLKEQISQLESENVAPKEWVLMGEAGTRQRPQNSLLEEDLEFERVMKAVPVTTEESVKTLEEIIKARILANQYDDVVRLRPLEDKPFLPSKFFEVNDSKSTQSLAQIYEQDYIASQTGGGAIDDRDGKLKKEHDEISAIWENICGKLDALCNAHFVPKQPKATISTVSNAATATLESALPTTASTSTMLAPEEVYSASSSSLRSRSELTPAEKRALRTKERKSKKRQRDALENSVDKFAKSKGAGSVKKQKQAALDSIVKHGKGVTVIGKKGQTTSKSKYKK